MQAEAGPKPKWNTRGCASKERKGKCFYSHRYSRLNLSNKPETMELKGNCTLLQLHSKKDVLFIIGDWNAKVGSQETPGVTRKLGLGIRNEAGQRLI